MMTLTKRNGNNLSAIPALFDDFFASDLFNWGNSRYSALNATLPAVNIRETDANFEVEMAAPGMKKEDFKVELNGNHLLISSTNRNEKEDGHGGYSRKEFSYTSFQRSFTLPKDVVDEDRIEARYEDGVLRLSIPKREEARKKAPRLIEIS
ncbi:Hsp20/alpha crystallin family protein [Olivibacter sp. XZL3]|uniref:Hsp20/alpha crystallin family protein n=1 Tax=Olivibacter sp. XZL3 TaxID=1735116 RepID=UPI001F0CEEB8|nr:Hsp20/alpha crystallin family protein [Olivibacter sp. XZL3]